jgi:rhodanese-related sulfurtransferase
MTITASTITTSTIHASELRRLLDEDTHTRILDVRTTGEFESVHIPGSFNVPLDLLGEHAADLADLEHPVVLVCQSGQRATTAHGKLQAAGKSNLRVLEGGIGAWQTSGGNVARGPERWTLERQVRLVAGSIVAGSVLAGAWFPKARLIAGAIGSGLTFSAVSNTCAMATALSRLPYNRGPRCDLDCVLRDMNAHRSAPAAA